MLYFKALQHGLSDLPQADPGLRAELDARAREAGWPALHAELARLDPVTAARLKPTDAQRIQRALEVCLLTGQPMSDFMDGDRLPEFPFRVIALALLPSDRAVLHQRIAQRFDAMLASGFLDEVRALRARGDLHPDLPSMRCVGYRQAWEALDGLWPLSELRDKGIYATRQLAKRQITWLRSMPERQVVACDAPDALAQVRKLARTFIESQP